MNAAVCEFCGVRVTGESKSCSACGSEIQAIQIDSGKNSFAVPIPAKWPSEIWIVLALSLSIAIVLSFFTEKEVVVHQDVITAGDENHSHDDERLNEAFDILEISAAKIQFAMRVADSLQAAGHPHAAATWGEKAFALDSQNVAIALQVANWHYDAGDKRLAVPFYRRYLEVFPMNWDVRVDLATALMEGESPMESVRELKAVLSANPNHQVANLNLGVLQFQIGNLAAADSLLQKARRINPTAQAGLRAIELLEIINKSNN